MLLLNQNFGWFLSLPTLCGLSDQTVQTGNQQQGTKATCFGSWSIPAVLQRTKKRRAGQWQVPERRKTLKKFLTGMPGFQVLLGPVSVFLYVNRCTLPTVRRWEQATAGHVQQIWKVFSTELFSNTYYLSYQWLLLNNRNSTVMFK